MDSNDNAGEPSHYANIITPASQSATSSQPIARRPSIRLLQCPSLQSVVDPIAKSNRENLSPIQHDDGDITTRRRSSSEPARLPWPGTLDTNLNRAPTQSIQMPPVSEETADQNPSQVRKTRFRSASLAARSTLRPSVRGITDDDEYDSGIVNILDAVDPEVLTLTTLTNVQNSLFVPDLGWLTNRRPTYTLTRRQHSTSPMDSSTDEERSIVEGESMPAIGRSGTITSTLSKSRFAVLPDGVSLQGWSASDKWEINDHVRHMLHSRRSKFKRGMKGFWQYCRKPLGFLVTLYATLITLFGLAWVLFLIGWINVGGNQLYAIHVIDSVLVALFAVVGDGLAPFRAVDTYHMIFIAYYHRLTWRLRQEKSLPRLQDKNDLPPRREEDINNQDVDIEKGELENLNDPGNPRDKTELSVLTTKQQQSLTHHANKFAKSHTFYKSHETTTHHAFPLRFLVAIVILLDCHSLLQISLGVCTWSIDYRVRPFALTTVILCFSICSNVAAGLLITIGDRRTRKMDVIEKMFRQELTEEAIAHVEKKKNKKKKEEKEDAKSSQIEEEDGRRSEE